MLSKIHIYYTYYLYIYIYIQKSFSTMFDKGLRKNIKKKEGKRRDGEIGKPTN